MTARPTSEAPVISAYGKPLKGKTVTIKCKHPVGPGRKLCGAERTIQVQDAFQVKRCAEHQKEYARQRRRERTTATATKSKSETEDRAAGTS